MKHILLTKIAAVVLVGCGESLSEFKDSQLRSAVKAGSIEDVKKAIANGANVNAMGFSSYGSLVKPPLHEAASRGHKDIVQLLIAKGDRVMVLTDTDNDGMAGASHVFVQELWLGPAAKRPFYRDYLPQKWRAVYGFGSGILGGFGCNLFFAYHSNYVLSGTNV